MDNRERASTTEETIRMAFQSMEAGLWTAMPGVIQSFNAAKMTCVVQPAIQSKQRNKQGIISNVTLPQLLDCPVVFPSGGGFALTFPLAQGDECLVVFASRCIDAWWQQGGVQPPMELRMHDLSDGFVLPGCFSQPHVIANISANTVQLRNKDGDTYVEIAGGDLVNVVSSTKITLTAPTVEIDASTVLTVNSPLLKTSGDMQDNYNTNTDTIGGMRTIYNTHTHPDPQGGNTGAPNQPM